MSHTIEDGMSTYPGLPAPSISEHLSREASRASYAEGTEFQIGRIDMVSNTGTYLDTPWHRFGDGWDLAGLALEKVALVPLVLVDAAGPAIGVDAFVSLDVRGRAVLVRTGWDRHWGTDRYGSGGHPYLTGAAAGALVAGGAAVVGIDSVNLDDMADRSRPAHTALLAAGIPVVEHLRGLDDVPVTDGCTFTAVPPKVAGMGTFAVRAFVAVP